MAGSRVGVCVAHCEMPRLPGGLWTVSSSGLTALQSPDRPVRLLCYFKLKFPRESSDIYVSSLVKFR